MFVLGRLKDASAIEAVMPFMDSPDLDEKAFAVKALGELRATVVFEKILSMLNDDDVYIRAEVVVALGNIGDERALPFLEEISRFDKTIVDGTDRSLGQFAGMSVESIRNRKLVQ